MGLHKYAVQEGTNAQLGQNGFDVIGENASAKQTPGSGTSWIAIQCIAGVVPTTTAYSAQFCAVKLYTNTGDDATTEMFMQPGDIIYGTFSSVINNTTSNCILLGHRG